MDIRAVKRALADAIRGIDRLDVYAFTPGSIVVPCAYVGEVEVDPLQAFGAGCDFADVKIRVLTSAADDEAGQADLDELLSRTGDRSIRARLEAARGAPGESALGGLADDLAVVRINGYRMYTEGTDEFYGADITVRVLGDGDA